MPINGISIKKEEGYVVCYIDELSDELKDLIRQELSYICHGKNEVEEYHLDHHSYKKTLTEFLKRYSSKSLEIKKGIMGEFIAHLIINKVLPNLNTISIFFNKEDLSMRKGFDLNYIDVEGNVVWYGEVKSGELNDTASPDDKNKQLLGAAKNGVAELLSGQRPNLWNSVIIDAGLSFASDQRKKVKELLDGDIREIEENSVVKKNAILVSVLFHDAGNKITPESVKEHLSKIVTEDIFSDVILFSIQKSTYTKIESFLNEEISQ